MSDNHTSQSEPSKPGRNQGRRPRFGRGAIVLAALVAGGLIGGFATKAFSHGPGGFGAGWHGPGSGFTRVHGGRFGFMRGPMTPEKAAKRAERMAKHLGVAVDATPEQTQKLVAIAKSLAVDVLPLRGEIRSTRRAAVDMLTSENLDRAALEKLRADQVARLDGVSKRLLEAIAEAADVLTPEQRVQVRERLSRWREAHHGGRWHRPETTE